jgi:hypothetical protein
MSIWRRFAVVLLHNRVILRQGVARQAGAERVIDAGAAECGILLEEAFGQRARLEHAHAGLEAVFAAEVGEFFQVVEVGVEVVAGQVPLVSGVSTK